MTGGRLKRVADYIGNNTFCMTYGDGLGNIDVRSALEFHRKSRKLATVTAVQPPGRFGAMNICDGRVTDFMEKPNGDGGWINGGFFVLEPKVMEYIAGDEVVWEKEPLEKLAGDAQIGAFIHNGFWQPMDTLREKQLLEELWETGKAPWKVW
jgi:glucose-1-phosphate cytidylyltransferase